MEAANMYLNFTNYYYPQTYIDPFLPYYDYWAQVYQQALNQAQNKKQEQVTQKLEDESPKIIHFPVNKQQQQLELSDPHPTQKKTRYFESRSRIDKQYRETKRIQKCAIKQTNEQKQNRNVYSNILRNFFRKVNDLPKIKDLVATIISKRKLNLTADEFLAYIKRLKINHGKYLRFKKLKHHFVDEKLKEHSIIFRILLEYFTNGDLLVQTLTSRKIGRWSVILHLKGTRDLKEKLYR